VVTILGKDIMHCNIHYERLCDTEFALEKYV